MVSACCCADPRSIAAAIAMNVILIGMKHCGKSTIGRMLAERWGCPFFDVDPMIEHFLTLDEVPPCPTCGGRLKHATVSFGQSLPEDVLGEAVELAERCEFFLTLGSSLVVEPAASLPRIAQSHGAKLVIINRDPTPCDTLADMVIHAPIGQSLAAITELLAK